MNPNRKAPAPIRQIELRTATFANTPFADATVTDLTFVNFFFGNNGTGKSTIARAIKEDKGVVYNPGHSRLEYTVHLYDEDYIDRNFHSYHGMPGLFTMDFVNVETQKQVDEKQEQITALKTQESEAETKIESKKKQLEKLIRTFRKTVWDKTKELRELFPETQKGYKNSQEKLVNRILEAEPKELDEKELTRTYESAFSDDAKEYPLFKVPEDPYVLDKIPNADLMDRAIVNTANSNFAEFFTRIGATEWVKAGHKYFSDRTDGKCPYCQQDLPDDFEQTLAESFDQLYEQQIREIDMYFHTYDEEAIELMTTLQQAYSVYHDLYPGLDSKTYDLKYAPVEAVVEKNKFNAMYKTDNPHKIYHIEPVGDRIKELCDMLVDFNKAIAANNEVVASQGIKREECINDVFSYLAFLVKDKIAEFKKDQKAIEQEIGDLESQSKDCRTSVINLQTEIRTLGGNKVDTSEAMKHINSILRDSGMQGFHLEPHETQPNVYKVVRENGMVADNLSEGEKNFIAFLYFYYQVQGLESPDDDKRNKIVIIDDPVSSMDSNSLFIVSTLVRNMIEVCRNNADDIDMVAEGKYIKQLFILTHNAFFHREITYNYVKRYAYVSFYLIRKLENKSSVKLCTKPDPEAPSQTINYNPVKSSYAALWEEYKQLRTMSSAVPLLSVMRKILDYYFLQLCGYDGIRLRKEILHDKKNEFKDSAGNEDAEQQTLARSMLRYISASKIGFSDGLHYVEESADPAVCCKAFETIFMIAGQHQHYRMMTEI